MFKRVRNARSNPFATPISNPVRSPSSHVRSYPGGSPDVRHKTPLSFDRIDKPIQTEDSPRLRAETNNPHFALKYGTNYGRAGYKPVNVTGLDTTPQVDGTVPAVKPSVTVNAYSTSSPPQAGDKPLVQDQLELIFNLIDSFLRTLKDIQGLTPVPFVHSGISTMQMFLKDRKDWFEFWNTGENQKRFKPVVVTKPHKVEEILAEAYRETAAGIFPQDTSLIPDQLLQEAAMNRDIAAKIGPEAARLKQKQNMDPKALKDCLALPETVVELSDAMHYPPRLHHGIDRALFNPGVYYMQDPNSNVYNFDPQLEKISPAADFDFSTLPAWTTSSQDKVLLDLLENDTRYVGSTSSLTGLLQHLHYLISDTRPLNYDTMSRGFGEPNESRTKTQTQPTAVFLRPQPKGGYAVDIDPGGPSATELMFLGHTLEKLLTVPKEEFDRHLKNHDNPVTSDHGQSHSYHYTKFGSLMVRSQLDAYDPRLKGSGIVDIKTRAVAGVRMDMRQRGTESYNYEIQKTYGKWSSFERERYDLMRTSMTKYLLQVRLGRMSGIILAYHNVKRIFGFEFVPRHEMDFLIHGTKDPALGDRELSFSMSLLDTIFQRVEQEFPGETIWLHFTYTKQGGGLLRIFAEAITGAEADRIVQESKVEQAKFEKEVFNHVQSNGQQKNNDATPQHTLVKYLQDINQTINLNITAFPKGVLNHPLGILRTQLHDHIKLAASRSTITNPLTNDERDQISKNIESLEDVFDEYIDNYIRKAIPGEPPANTATTRTTDPNKLLVMELGIQNLYNGEIVTRVDKLSQADAHNWILKQRLSIVNDEETKMKLHARLRKTLEKQHQDAEKPYYYTSGFFNEINNMGRQGRLFRERRDKELEGNEVYQFEPYAG